jgi:hypothetical protein
VSSGGKSADIIPAADAFYDINSLTRAIGSATFVPVPVTNLSSSPQAVVTATNVNGNTSATWDPLIQVLVPPEAIAGSYPATITQSVS